MVGTGAQPLHTDGAHLRRMPDIVILSAAAPTPTPTLLYRPGSASLEQRSGVFRVGGGRGTFYAGAIDGAGRWRYDPGCMAPTDAEAREAADQFRAMSDAAERHEWSRQGEVLVIANRHVLHARAAAADADSRRLHRVALRTGWED
ncbi:TauD/TfdA family dioxygenase [Microbacterium sp. ZOR0019]|uniref:TauD/TfdA family dioxygenase n=1 Tax=Microbacterium sp. ZOR0019 TaxID=1339233 RepID=UPI0009E01EDB